MKTHFAKFDNCHGAQRYIKNAGLSNKIASVATELQLHTFRWKLQSLGEISIV